MPQIGQRPHNPIIAPGPILLGHANNQFLNFSVDPWPARGSPFLRAIELAGDEPSVPCQDGVRQGGSRHLAECLATQSTANLAELRSLCVRELQPPLQLAPQNPVFSSQILVPQQQLLVHRPRNVGQDTCPLHESPPICPPIREGAVDRPKKPSGRHAARLRRDGITARLSCSFNFLTTRLGTGARIKIKPEYFPAFEPLMLLPAPIVLSIDTAQKGGPDNSYNVIQAWTLLGHYHYLIVQWRQQCGYLELLATYKSFVRKHRPSVVLIEDTANGSALLEEAKRMSWVKVIAITPDGRSKAKRLLDHMSTIRRKRVHLPDGADWRGAFVAELVSFPGEFDDQVDAMPQYLTFMATNPTLELPPKRAIMTVGSRGSFFK